MATLKEKTKKKVEYTQHSCFSTNILQLTSSSLTVSVFCVSQAYITSTTGALVLFICGSFFLPTHVTEQTFGFVMLLK
jgi:hypothetical protein